MRAQSVLGNGWPTTPTRTRRPTRPGGPGGFLLVLVLLAGIGLGWAGSTLLAPPSKLPEPPGYTLVAAVQGSVERSLTLNAAASWAGGQELLGQLAGTVTAVHLRGSRQVAVGDAVYDVDLMPVLVATGRVPAFRDLGPGARGADVAQLQELLRSLGHRRQPADGQFDARTGAQVRSWQRARQLPVTGTVPRGLVLFVPRLPATLAVLPEVRVGAAAPLGAPVARVLPASPGFSITLPANQASLVRAGMSVRLRYDESQWQAVIARVAPLQQDGTAVATLGPVPGQAAICAEQCSRIPLAGEAGMLAAVQVVPRIAGVTIPTQALRVGADGTAAVTLQDGTDVSVVVKGSSGGIAVVEGLSVGQKVQVPARAGA